MRKGGNGLTQRGLAKDCADCANAPAARAESIAKAGRASKGRTLASLLGETGRGPFRRVGPRPTARPPGAAAPESHRLHSNYVLNRGYAYTTIIGSKHSGQTLLFHLASLYPHST